MTIDLNADVGEGYDDAPLFAYLSSANVACGGHAGDEDTMRRTLRAAAAAGVAVGAHPSYPDREGFGRRVTTRDPAAISDFVFAQTARLRELAEREGIPLTHVKPHGSLYNVAAAEPAVAEAVARAVSRIDQKLALFGLAGSKSEPAAMAYGLRFVSEAFVDRAYREDGSLLPRSEPGAVLEDPQVAAERALGLARFGRVESVTGTAVSVQADTLCLHGDTAGALEIAVRVSRRLAEAGIRVVSCGECRPRST